MATIPTTRGSPSGDAPPVWPRRSVRFPEFPGDPVERLAEGRQLRSFTAAASQSAPLDITKLVQQTTGVITGVAELALIGAAFMLAIGQTLMGNHLAHDRPWTPPMKIGTGQIRAIEIQSAALRGAMTHSSV
jgi:hypothetical protein